MKKQIVSLALALTLIAAGTASQAAPSASTKPTAEQKVINDFTSEFSSTPTIALVKHSFIANSVVDGNSVSCAYDKRGNKIYSIIRYDAANMNPRIAHMVAENYDTYSITFMARVEQPGQPTVFVVTIANPRSIKTLRVTHEGVELVQDIKKA